jgi:ribonuclease HII
VGGTGARLRGGGAAKGVSPTKSARPRQRGPSARFEKSLSAEGFETVAGLDEVGRGAWAGPVSVGVVVLPLGVTAPKGIRDSKQLTEERREELFPKIIRWCTAWSVGHASPVECDRLGMTAALRLASRRALDELQPVPQIVAMDGSFDYVSDPLDTDPLAADPLDTDPLAADPLDTDPAEVTSARLPQVRTVVKGDVTCVSIAAASIVAKVTRDRLMRSMSASFPGFDFDRNKGYPSRVHRTALAGFGLTSLHRRTWSYVDELAFR